MTNDPHVQGVTLVELLVSIAVAALVFVAAVSVFLTVTESLRRQQGGRMVRAHEVLDDLRHDLASCAQVPISNVPAFLLEYPVHETNEAGFASLAFTVGSIPGPADDFSKLEIKRIRYSVISGDQASDPVLMRESLTLWGPDALSPAISNVVMEGVSAFEMGVDSDSGWTNTWKSSGKMLLPRAVRIRLNWKAESTNETASAEVFIPAGNQIPGGGADRPVGRP